MGRHDDYDYDRDRDRDRDRDDRHHRHRDRSREREHRHRRSRSRERERDRDRDRRRHRDDYDDDRHHRRHRTPPPRDDELDYGLSKPEPEIDSDKLLKFQTGTFQARKAVSQRATAEKKKKEERESEEAVLAEYAEYFSGEKPKPAAKAAPKKQMDSFLDELKRKQKERQARAMPQPVAPVVPLASAAALASAGTSAPPGPLNAASLGPAYLEPYNDSDDPTTTNLYVGNLSPNITEEILVKEFGRYGAIGSVKIMWPRTEEEKSRQRNCGFVSFMDRDEAARAKDDLNGRDLMGYELRIGWGKTVSRPVAPLFVPHGGKSEQYVNPNMPKIHVDQNQLKSKLLNTLAQYVSKFGIQFEEVIKSRERNNPHFAWMFQPFGEGNKELIFYKWRVYSLLQGDNLDKWRTAPFQMFASGPVWFPPPIPTEETSISSNSSGRKRPADADADEDRSEKRQKGHTAPLLANALDDADRDIFFEKLRKLNSSRDSIKELMVFAMDHANCAQEVVEILTEALTLSETPVQTKVARLYLLSDILYNSAAKVRHASQFRTHFEYHLEEIFKSFNELYIALGRISGEKLNEQVSKVLAAWDQWSVYSPQLIQKLRTILLKGPST